MKVFISAILILLGSSCFQNSKFDTCDRANEKLVRVDGGEKCLANCGSDSDCDNDDVCVSSVCAPKGTILTIVNTDLDEPDVGDDIDTGPTITLTEASKACDDVKQKALSCSESQCSGEGLNMETILELANLALNGKDTTCEEDYIAELSFRESVLEVTNLECSHDFWKSFYCSIGLNKVCSKCEAASKVGASCTTDSDCEGGDVPAFCIVEDAEESVTFFEGYCIAGCSATREDEEDGYSYKNSEQCGSSNICSVDEGDVYGVCWDGCTTHQECRPGYLCQIWGFDVEDDELIRLCTPVTEDCDPLTCKNGRQCGIELGPEGVPLSVCQFECANNDTQTFCESIDGTCIGEDQTYCVLP